MTLPRPVCRIAAAEWDDKKPKSKSRSGPFLMPPHATGRTLPSSSRSFLITKLLVFEREVPAFADQIRDIFFRQKKIRRTIQSETAPVGR